MHISPSSITEPASVSDAEQEPIRADIKVLMLGAANSGKTTIGHQLRFRYGDKFSDLEISEFKRAIQSSAIQILINLLSKMLSDNKLDGDLKVLTSRFLAKRGDTKLALELWRNSVIQENIVDAVDNPDDPATSFLPSLDRILALDYMPTEVDILTVKVPTTGVSEVMVPLGHDLILTVIDMGGQRSQREKVVALL